MEKVITLYLFFVLLNLFSILHVGGESNGLAIKFIHQDSSESPFYQPNLTYIERIERFVKQSKTRLEHLSYIPSDVRSKIYVEQFFIFSAQIALGTFPKEREQHKSYHFLLDVRSSLTWLECQDCKLPGHHCFREVGEPFPDRMSTTYQRLSCIPTPAPLHPLCDPRVCIGEFCAYQMRYLDNSTSTGYLAHETFTFDTSTLGGRKEMSNLVFGCGFDIRSTLLKHSRTIAGVLGLGWGPQSFVTQLGSKSNGKFSYCLPRMTQQNLTSYLQFGNRIPTARATSKTPLHKYPPHDIYFVNLIGITAAGKRLKIMGNVFARNPNNDTGGCVMDSGCGVTLIVNAAYEKLKERLTEYFESVHGFRKTTMQPYNFCYKRNAIQGFRNLPTITFHFEKADLKLDPESIYLVGAVNKKEVICLAMLPNNEANRLTIIGAYQQTNHRFVYNTRENVLQFGPENCARHS